MTLATIKVVYRIGGDLITAVPEAEAVKIATQIVKESTGAVYVKIEYTGRWQMYNVNSLTRELTLGINSTTATETVAGLMRE